tara:strand:+ start:688 stop:975 length:288 start_codon:yes stop_codon:yes gene_type:complete
MNNKFTKGEWSVLGEVVIAEKGHKTIKPLCSLNGRMSPEEDGANAHLIAAAPDMYALLLKFLPMDEDGNGPFEYNDGSEHYGKEVETLLAKARGE